MKIKLLPFAEAMKKSKQCSKEHLTRDFFCIGISKREWRDNAVLEAHSVSYDGYYLAEDGYFYCECCCEVEE